MLVRTYNPRIWKAKAEKSRDWASLGSKATLSQSKIRKIHGHGTS